MSATPLPVISTTNSYDNDTTSTGMSFLNPPVRVVIVGASTAAGRRHVDLVAGGAADAVLVAIIDPTPAGDELAHALGVINFADVEDVLDSDICVQVAIIASSDPIHLQTALQLLECDIHLFLEAPLCADSESARLLLAAEAVAPSARITVGHHQRFHPVMSGLRRDIIAGKLGRIVGISGMLTTRKPAPPTKEEWLVETPAEQPLSSSFIHEVDMLQFLLGSITRVYCEEGGGKARHNETLAVTASFKSGAVGTLLLTDAAHDTPGWESPSSETSSASFGNKPQLMLLGTSGTMILPDLSPDEPSSQSLARQPSTASSIDLSTDTYLEQLNHLIDVVRGDVRPLCDGRAAASAVQVIEAINRSLTTGQPQNIFPLA